MKKTVLGAKNALNFKEIGEMKLKIFNRKEYCKIQKLQEYLATLSDCLV